MSTERESETNAAPVAASSASAQVDAFFDRVAASGPQPRLRNVTGVCQFDIQGAGTYWASLKRGVITVTKGRSGDVPPANCVISCTVDDLLRILRHEGHMNVYAAVLQEILTVTGDTPFAWTVMGTFEISPAQGLAI